MRTLSPFREDVELADSTETQYDDETWYAPEIVGSAPPVAEQEASEWEEEAFDFGEAETEAGHPILALFPLPPAVLEALSNGLGSVAVGLAANAGYRDVNRLTNIVFYFRHPNLIGRKIRPDERDLAAEWVSIRDRLVKPALRSTVSGLPTSAPADAPAAPTVIPDVLSPDRLQWPGHSQAELDFMKAVYAEHRKRSRGDFVMDLPEGALGPIEGRKARKDAAEAARKMLDAARKEFEVVHPEAQIGIVSAYRPATQQFQIWQGRDPKGKDEGSGFPHYYREAIQLRLVDADDFNAAAAKKVAEHLGGYIAFPGYSNHQDGLAFDFGVGLKGKRLGKLRAGSWFHKWLKAHADEHHFVPLKTEAWHWTYHPPAASKEVWAGEAQLEVAAPVRAGEVRVPRIPLLARHRGSPPDLILRWNDMPSVPEEIDVVVHLHGFWYDRMSLVRDIEPVSGLDLVPVRGESGEGRTRPTLTVLPRGNNTGVKQTHGPYNAYTFPALVTKTGLPDLLRVALERFAAEVGGSAPRVGRLILTAHSGGGKALLQILQYHDPHQVHVFDALYWPPEPLVAWARKRIAKDRAAGAGADYMAREGGGLRVFYQGRYQGGTRPNSLAVRKALTADIDPSVAPWYRVEASKYDHFQIPRLYGWRVLSDVAADVPQAYVEQTRPRREAEPEWEDDYEDDGREDFASFDEAEEEDEEDEDLFGEGELPEAEKERTNMSAMNPFREDAHPEVSFETVALEPFEAEAWYSTPLAARAEPGEWEQPAWDETEGWEGSAPALSAEVAHPDPLAGHSREVGLGAEESQNGSADRMPWDVVTESEDMTAEAWVSEAYGAEPQPEGLTFYGQDHELGDPPGLEHEDTLLGSLKKLLAKGYWSAAVTFAVITGERDRNKLTNMLFWARHPELDGKKIPPGNKNLADEWKAIYKQLVLPPLGPVSPSTVGPTAVPSEQKSVDTLIIDIFNSEQQVLTAWSGALTQFQVVMSAHSDAEGVPDFVGAVMKHVGEQVISKIAGQVPGVSYAKGMLDTVTKEYERAREARTSAQLRDFLVRFTQALTDAMNDLGRGFGDYKHMVETGYAKGGPDEKKQYQKALADHLSSLDRNWTNVTNVFLLICQEWIRNTTYKEYYTAAPAFVRISVNKDKSVRGVELLCHGGQKIAEQLLKNAGGTGLRPYAWPVPRRFLYFVDSSSWPNAFINLTSDGRWVQQGSIAENAGAGSTVLEYIRKNGLEATTKVKGR